MFSSVNFVQFFFQFKCVIFPEKPIMFHNVVLKGLRLLFRGIVRHKCYVITCVNLFLF